MNECEKDVLLSGKITRPMIKGKPIPPPVAKNNLFKTQLCRNYMSTGKCKYGRVYQFAHGRKELAKYSFTVVVHEMVLAFRRFNRRQALMNCNSSSFHSPTPCCIEQ